MKGSFQPLDIHATVNSASKLLNFSQSKNSSKKIIPQEPLSSSRSSKHINKIFSTTLGRSNKTDSNKTDIILKATVQKSQRISVENFQRLEIHFTKDNNYAGTRNYSKENLQNIIKIRKVYSPRLKPSTHINHRQNIFEKNNEKIASINILGTRIKSLLSRYKNVL